MSIIAKYKFDSSIYSDLLPEFNSEFTSDLYTVTDEVDSENSNHIIRTIESESLPTLMRFGRVYVEGESATDNRADSLLEVLSMNTSGLTSCYSMFRHCKSLTSITCEWDTSNVTNMNSMFDICSKLTTLDVSSLNTSNVTSMVSMFYNCNKLTSLDLSNFNTSKVTNTSYMFNNTLLLTDIGMLYCDQSTINKIASLLPTDVTQIIWVEDVDIKDLTPVEGIEFKQYAKNTEVMLTSPLLEGDKLIVKDGKTYHYHKMGKVVLDGSEDWVLDTSYQIDNMIRFNMSCGLAYKKMGYGLCDKFHYNNNPVSITNYECIGLHAVNPYLCIYVNNKRALLNVDDFKQWLQANPTTVVYELASPYYELISDKPLTASLIAESSDITNSSNIPLNMTINNKGLSTVAMSSSTTYTVAFDKDTDGEIVVNLCGNEVATTDNIVEITTPSEIDDELIFYGDGVEVSNIRLLEGSVSGDSIPRESFEGLKNSFEDGYIPENLMTTDVTETGGSALRREFSKNIYKSATVIIPSEYVGKLRMSMCKDNLGWYNNYDITNTVQHFSCNADEYYNCVSIAKAYISSEELANLDIIVLEGDWTHLTEEDFNHLGKYKVEYKVTGKNKFDIGKLEDIHRCTINDNSITFTPTDIFTCRGSYNMNLKPNTTYTLSIQTTANIGGLINYPYVQIQINLNGNQVYDHRCYINSITFTTPLLFDEVKCVVSNGYFTNEVTLSNIQLEEGSIATEYEPYKEYTKTFYLNSPLLEGDTIEDVNGVATHVKRWGKVVLDGSKNWTYNSGQDSDNTFRYNLKTDIGCTTVRGNIMCDKLSVNLSMFSLIDNKEGICNYSNGLIYIRILKTKLPTSDIQGFKQWLQANPTTVVYQLASPIYEPISTESILCDSYVNGHLDFDSNVPVEKVEFKNLTDLHLKYLQPNTDYTIQLESDNIGIINWMAMGSNSIPLRNIDIIKGINRVEFTTEAGLTNNLLKFSGIGFNASNIQVVATDRNVNFGYFKGLQSSFESELVTDEADENYGKHKVECKIVGKNKFDGLLESGDININTGALKADAICIRTVNYIDVRNMDEITLTRFDHTYTTSFRLYDSSYNYIGNASGLGSANTATIDVSNVSYIKFRVITSDTTVKYQLEEGTQATSYEPYQEYTKTIYLNSPLLKGDAIEVVGGKLCHYHKMGKVVLDGSENWKQYNDNQVNNIGFYFEHYLNTVAHTEEHICYCSSIQPFRSDYMTGELKDDKQGIFFHYQYIKLSINKSKLLTQNTDGFKQWLQTNPITVVYKLTEPYYEEISPLQEDLIITSVKEGDLHIDTIVPISSKVTYNVNVQLLTNFEQSIVEQVQATQTTDLQSILDEETDN